MKKLTALFMSLVLAVGLCPVSAFADSSGLAAVDAPVASVALQGASAQVGVQASSGYVAARSQGTTVKAGGASFKLSSWYANGVYSSKITMAKGGKTTVVATGVTASFVTNGRYVFYAKQLSRTSDWQYKCALYRHDTKTGKKVKLTTGIDLDTLACSGRYLYYGRNNGADGVSLRAYDLKKRSSRGMANSVGTVLYKKGRVITVGNHGDATNVPIYSFKASGKGRVKVAKGLSAVVKGNVLYYTVVKYGDGIKFRVYRCTLTGKHKKAVTGWRSTLPKKYQ